MIDAVITVLGLVVTMVDELIISRREESKR
jgi:hypothetical protein